MIAARWEVDDDRVRLRHAENLRPYANPEVARAVVGGFNPHSSGRTAGAATSPTLRHGTGVPADERSTDAVDRVLVDDAWEDASTATARSSRW